LASVHISISWLWCLFVLDHLILETNQDLLHGVVWVPVFEHVELALLNNTIILVDGWNIDLRIEFNSAWDHRIAVSANDLHHVNPVIEVSALRSNNSAIPVGERLIVTLVKSIRDVLIGELSMLSFLQLFVESKGSWNFGLGVHSSKFNR
jgi:5-carboxymethyl-2-hydroxymuconate isomerase